MSNWSFWAFYSFGNFAARLGHVSIYLDYILCSFLQDFVLWKVTQLSQSGVLSISEFQTVLNLEKSWERDYIYSINDGWWIWNQDYLKLYACGFGCSILLWRNRISLIWLRKSKCADLCHRHNSADSVPTYNLVCIRMSSILNSQSRDLKHGVPLATNGRSFSGLFCLMDRQILNKWQNLKPVQIESICIRQNKCGLILDIHFGNNSKHCGNINSFSLPAFSTFPIIFSEVIPFRVINSWYCVVES